jgi:hypothetical protein
LILDGIERMIEEVGKKEKNMWPATTELRQDWTGYCLIKSHIEPSALRIKVWGLITPYQPIE